MRPRRKGSTLPWVQERPTQKPPLKVIGRLSVVKPAHPLSIENKPTSSPAPTHACPPYAVIRRSMSCVPCPSPPLRLKSKRRAPACQRPVIMLRKGKKEKGPSAGTSVTQRKRPTQLPLGPTSELQSSMAQRSVLGLGDRNVVLWADGVFFKGRRSS